MNKVINRKKKIEKLKAHNKTLINSMNSGFYNDIQRKNALEVIRENQLGLDILTGVVFWDEEKAEYRKAKVLTFTEGA